MSLKHLGTGSTCPPIVKGMLRCYNMKYCPYAQRALIVLAAKNIKHDVVNINLKKKPEWFLEKSPLGKVPLLEQDGKLMFESLVICDYLNEAYPDPPLYPADPWKKAEDKMFLERFNKIPAATIKVILANNDEQKIKQGFDDFRATLNILEAELTKRNTKFYGGGTTPGMLDYMIWPWIERLPVMQDFVGVYADIANDEFPKLFSWIELMKEDPAVKYTYLTPEAHLKYFNSKVDGIPDYDIQ